MKLLGNSTFIAARISRFEVTRVRCRGVGVASTGSAQSFFACGVLILPNCRHALCCTAEWWRRECAGEAGRSRRPRQWRVSGAGSTRFHHTEMVRPAVGAATTERWSGRGPGVRLHRLPNEPRMNTNAGSSCFPARDLPSASGCLRTAAAGRGGAGCWSHAKTRRREGKSRGGCLVFEQGLRQMPDGTHGRCQGCLSKVMT